jgi:hypothetical protein
MCENCPCHSDFARGLAIVGCDTSGFYDSANLLRLFWTKRKEEVGEHCIMELFHDFHSSPNVMNVVKQRMVRRVGGATYKWTADSLR